MTDYILRKPTIAELEAALNDPATDTVEVLPNGEVTTTSILETLRTDNQELQQRVAALDAQIDRTRQTMVVLPSVTLTRRGYSTGLQRGQISVV